MVVFTLNGLAALSALGAALTFHLRGDQAAPVVWMAVAFIQLGLMVGNYRRYLRSRR